MFGIIDQIICDLKNEIETLKEVIIGLQHEIVDKNKEIKKLKEE